MEYHTLSPKKLAATLTVTSLNVVSIDECALLASKSRIALFQRGEALLRQGDTQVPLIHLLTGQVKLICSAARGRECVLHVLSRPALINVGSLFSLGMLPYSCTALTKGSALLLDKSTLLATLTQNSALAQVFLRNLSLREHLLTHKIANSQGHFSLSSRVSSWLLHRTRMKNSLELTVPGPRELLARLLGISRESLSRELGRLQSLGAIAVSKKNITILDPEALQKMVEE